MYNVCMYEAFIVSYCTCTCEVLCELQYCLHLTSHYSIPMVIMIECCELLGAQSSGEVEWRGREGGTFSRAFLGEGYL